MVSFPNGKINLGLQVVEKRTDGYHNLQTIFYPIAVMDALEIIQAPQFAFTTSGLIINADNNSNLCTKAYKLLQKDFDLPPVHIYLHKAIPMGAGLGGGSADGAFTLQLLNNKFKLQLTQQQLISYALQLGSDCAFFIINKPCYATGRGEVLTLLETDVLKNMQVVIVNPGIHISTGWAFNNITPCPTTSQLTALWQQPITTWPQNLVNDFEAPVMQAYPAIAAVKNELYAQGALYASMTGSGSTVYGLFEKDKVFTNNFPGVYMVKVVML
jgi:4-diphosphocytidyl-2-C-methyl-D-erythritol kinase